MMLNGKHHGKMGGKIIDEKKQHKTEKRGNWIRSFQFPNRMDIKRHFSDWFRNRASFPF